MNDFFAYVIPVRPILQKSLLLEKYLCVLSFYVFIFVKI